jgi:hypothetical protein
MTRSPRAVHLREWPRWRAVPLGAGALAAVGLALWNVALMTQLRDVQAQEDAIRGRLARHSEVLFMATSGQLVLRRLQPTALAPNAQVSLLIEPGENRAMLMATHLPPLPPEHLYQVWFGRGGLRHAVGRFAIDERGNTEANLNVPPDGLSAYESAWITVEPMQGTPTPNSPGIARGPL